MIQEKINNNKDNESIMKVRNVVSTMAIEDMYFSRKFIQDMVKVAKGELSSEDVRKEIIKKYAR